jgi:predicted dehydrogenase
MWLGPAPYVPFEKERCIYHFRWFWDYSGGQTTNLLAHQIDIVQWVTEQLPRSACSMGGRYSLKGIGETPDVFESVFDYPGFVATWSSREIAARTPGTRGGLEFVGTSGVLLVDRGGLEVLPDALTPPDDQIPEFTRPRRVTEGRPKLRTTAMKWDGFDQVRDQFQPHVRNFIDCIKSRKQPVSDLESGHQTSVSCHLANLSLKLREGIHWDWDKEEVIGNAKAAALLTKEYRPPWDRELKGALPKTS